LVIDFEVELADALRYEPERAATREGAVGADGALTEVADSERVTLVALDLSCSRLNGVLAFGSPDLI
jgi:hypothetical protein